MYVYGSTFTPAARRLREQVDALRAELNVVNGLVAASRAEYAQLTGEIATAQRRLKTATAAERHAAETIRRAALTTWPEPAETGARRLAQAVSEAYTGDLRSVS
jgi:peptidoglycan hydrolase CwlO-like protein